MDDEELHFMRLSVLSMSQLQVLFYHAAEGHLGTAAGRQLRSDQKAIHRFLL